MKDNPWHDIKPEDYDAHMSHPNVAQTQMLNRIVKEQFELLPAADRPASQVCILGITNGNGLEHVIPCGIGHVVGIDINQEFLRECAMRYPSLAQLMCLHRLDLIIQTEEAVNVITSCDLIIANLVIEHIHLAPFTKIVSMLPKHRRMVSCVIQANPDGSLASASGVEHVFDSIVTQVEEEDETALSQSMKDNGYSFKGRTSYALPNGKLFIRLDFYMA